MNEFRIYKPNNKDISKGGATAIQFRMVDKDKYKTPLCFWVSTQQTEIEDTNGNAGFGWKDDTKRIDFKLGAGDIGAILLLLKGIRKNLGNDKGLYHQNPKGNSVLNLNRLDNGNISMRLSAKKDGKLVVVNHLIGIAEGEVLLVLLEEFLRCMYVY